MNDFNTQFLERKEPYVPVSDWGRQQLQRRQEESAQRKVVRRCVPVPKPRPPKTAKRYPRKPRDKQTFCGCGEKKRVSSDICYRCKVAIRNSDRRVCGHPQCYVLLQRNNKLGKCLKHAAKERNKRSYEYQKKRIQSNKKEQ